ncbi:AhpC/TSA family protein [Nitzschia inconspicua]|uniref:AhpC/TSA family protein n=1 Tax=Nitzschia inconspicua TaxID=303405 RepID=A0A9K3LQU4_9STRA|nr:AhpC/TSA family protein [Nitzschia inconspicua]
MPVADLPQLPLVCLKTADFKDTKEVTRGKNTVIDFWTTKCTRCPDALDKLNHMAQDPKYQDVQFISICCDKLDGARDIIEKEDDLRWQNIDHYFMSQDDKETAKKALGFKQVPYYVVLDEEGNIQQSGGGKQVDFDEIPGIIRPQTPPPSPMKGEEPSESSFDDIGLGSDDEFCLDFVNKLGMTDGPNNGHSTSQVIDETFFDDDDF